MAGNPEVPVGESEDEIVPLHRGTTVPMWSCEVRANRDGPGNTGFVDAIRATDTRVRFGAGPKCHAHPSRSDQDERAR